MAHMGLFLNKLVSLDRPVKCTEMVANIFFKFNDVLC